ncbi:hypothetical protein SDJN02_01422 [Cucurbita argyrosperma subsp. argyrosperma]|nr:hypothetical protein SDJN02_01422 [Cucurbita argyrosperma subsp. argyrosperma]
MNDRFIRFRSAQTISGTIPYSRFPAKFNCSTFFKQAKEKGNGPVKRRKSKSCAKSRGGTDPVKKLNRRSKKIRELGNVRGDGACKFVGIGMKHSNVRELIEEAFEGWCTELEAIEVYGCNSRGRLGTPLKASGLQISKPLLQQAKEMIAEHNIDYGVDNGRREQVAEQKQQNTERGDKIRPRFINQLVIYKRVGKKKRGCSKRFGIKQIIHYSVSFKEQQSYIEGSDRSYESQLLFSILESPFCPLDSTLKMIMIALLRTAV